MNFLKKAADAGKAKLGKDKDPAPKTSEEYQNPQWDANSPTTTSGNTCESDRIPCSTCNNAVKECTCKTCARCNGSIKIGRHHCFKCGVAVCSKCRSKERQQKIGMGNFPKVKVCNICALRPALTTVIYGLIDDGDFSRIGLLLLLENSDPTKRCIDHSCDVLTYYNNCPKCTLPTITQAFYQARGVSVTPPFKAKVEIMNLKHKEIREKEVSNFSQKTLAEAVGKGIPRFHEKLDMNAKLLLGLACAGYCYEYGAAGYTTLQNSPIPYHKCLRLISTSQLVSVYEAPGKVRFVAFPGTHDARTAYTDVQYHRTPVTVSRKVNVGNGVHGGIIQDTKYLAHSGFLKEAKKVILPEVSDWITEGYEIVYCGHSLGGAIATLATVQQWVDNYDKVHDKLICVTAGAPMVGCYRLRNMMNDYHALDKFHHFIYRGDIVPRLLMGREAPEKMKKVARQALVSAKAAIGSLAGRFLKGKSEPEPEPEPEVDLEGGDAEEIECPIVEMTPPSQRSFEYFGTYHLLGVGLPDQGESSYLTTNDSEKAYQWLARGLRSSTPLDHFNDVYTKAAIRHGMMGNTI